MTDRIKQGILIVLAAVCARFGWEIVGSYAVELWRTKGLAYVEAIQNAAPDAKVDMVVAALAWACVIWLVALAVSNFNSLVMWIADRVEDFENWRWHVRMRKRATVDVVRSGKADGNGAGTASK